RWWADAAELSVDGALVHRGDLFDTACRWPLPERWWLGEPLQLELRLRSPLHDDGALIHSRIELEPLDPGDPADLLAGTRAQLQELRRQAGQPPQPPPGAGFHVLGHAHLDLAWLWPVADTWQAAERTFASALALMERFPQLHFAHSTPALYAWLGQHRPALLARLQAAVAAGRFEPINGPWVESDCVLISTASLLRQFEEGQAFSRAAFPTLGHGLAWLPDSFGFAAGLPSVAAATGVRWFCTHKLAWNATNPFPHRLFRWRSRCGSEVLALMTAPIGTDGDPEAMEGHRLDWRQATGLERALWLPGVGDHGGGPTAEMLEQLALWQRQAAAAPQRHGTLRQFLAELEPLAPRLPVWREELYLELHRGCATSRPDQKRHNRTLERLLREAELARALAPVEEAAEEAQPLPWRDLLFQQFHDILPGTSIPEVFEQAEPQWRRARRAARQARDRALFAWLGPAPPLAARPAGEPWWLAQLQPLAEAPLTLRLPPGRWSLPQPAGPQPLPQQPAAAGGTWVQLSAPAGVGALALLRQPGEAPAASPQEPLQPVQVVPDPERGPAGWRLENGLLAVALGPAGVEQLWDAAGQPQLAAPLAWRRFRDRGEFWDAWDLAADYRDHPLPWEWSGAPEWLERGPLCAAFRWRGHCGSSAVRLDGRLRAGCPWLELTLSLDWRQRHELLRLEVPLAWRAVRWASDTSGGVLERPAEPVTERERSRWEVPAISWTAALGAPGSASARQAAGLAVLLRGPQGVSAGADHLGVSLLRGPTWPDPSADNGLQRQTVALMPCPGGWRAAGVPEQALRLREPLWLRPASAAPESTAAPATATVPPPLALPPLDDDLQLIALTDDPAPGVVRLAVQNLGPCRRRLDPGPGWRVLEAVDGLYGAAVSSDGSPEAIRPWALRFFRVQRIVA
ncbi:MAG: glycoside hydrolase family 38 C-terminal domain-containing protein, partial [Synechococcus sp.]|nr:glycoside hydrolase family 38 C-terminal domain-containing protein [Synechococcus sp.]